MIFLVYIIINIVMSGQMMINNESINTTEKSINQENIVNKIDKNKKGRKIDAVRKYFIREDDDYIKCIILNCKKKFSCKSSVSVLKYHLLMDHGQTLNKKTSNNNNNNMEKENGITSEAEIYKALAIAFAKNSLPHSLIEDKYFKNALEIIKNNKTINLNKKNLRDVILIESEKINEELLINFELNKTPITLAIDGWTNVRSNKVTNLILIVEGISYYYASIENENNKNNVEWLAPQLEEKIKYLYSKKINIIAIVADNENLMKAISKKLKIKFPVLIDVPCAAHIIQLCFKKICEIQNIKNIINEINEIIYLIRNNKENRNKLCQLQIKEGIKEPLKIKYHTEIRWSSLIISIKRILSLKKYIIEIINESKFKSTDKFWDKLNSLYEYIKIFESCTNHIQKDNASLYSVWTNLNKLINYYELNNPNNELINNGNLIVQIIKDKWNEHINIDLINVTRLFNFEQNFKISDKSLKFIEEWGSKYLIEFSLIDNKDVDVVKQIIYLQISEFLSRQKEFSSIDSIISNLKKACEIQNTQYSAKFTWGRFSASHYELSKIAIAILSICPSESSVERSFSALSDIHTLERNRLTNNIIEAELKIKWNYQ
jgi:hypothetical protein